MNIYFLTSETNSVRSLGRSIHFSRLQLFFVFFLYIYVKQEDWGRSTLTRTRYSCTFHLRNFLMFNSGTKVKPDWLFPFMKHSWPTGELMYWWEQSPLGSFASSAWCFLSLRTKPLEPKKSGLGEPLGRGTPVYRLTPRAHSTCAVCCQWWTWWEIRPSNRPGGLLFAEMQVGKGQLHSFYFDIF